MDYHQLDNLFVRSSQGDAKAQNELINHFISISLKLLQKEFRDGGYNLIAEDYLDILYELYFQMIAAYNQSEGPFSCYFNSTIKRRIKGKYLYIVKNLFVGHKSLDEIYEDGSLYIESISSPEDLNISEQIEKHNFRYEIASPAKGKTKEEKLMSSIAKLNALGFSKTEISKKLGLTIGKVRYMFKKMQENRDEVQFKFDIK